MIGSRHVSCSADGKYVICSVHGFTPLDDLNIVSATTSSANWYPVLSRNYGTNWDLLTSETFKDYHLLDNTDLSLNTSNSLNNCVGTAVSKTGKYVACAFNSAASIPKPIMFYLSSDYGKTFDLKANLEVDDATYISNGLQISLSSNAETISLVSTKSATEVYYSSDYGTSWNTKSIALSNDEKEHYSQISSNSQYLVRNITSDSGSDNYYHSKLCKQITPYEKTYYTHMVKDFSNISNGNSSADSSITYSGGILTASDYRLKSNVQQLQDETVDNLQPVKFTFKNSQHETFGLIAHELEENYPFLVDGEKDGSHYQTVNYNGLLGVLVHELQLIRKGLEEYE